MHLGCDGIFVGSGIFKSSDPEKRARTIVKATAYYNDHQILLEVSENLGNAMDGIEINILILTGDESTTLGILLHHFNLLHPIRELILQGFPVWGTCAGMILLTKKIIDQSVHYLGVMDIVVKRNAFGRQLESFTTEAVIEAVSPSSMPLVFIRAPYIESVHQDVQVLATIKNHIVAARQRNMLATSFHPELSFPRYTLLF